MLFKEKRGRRAVYAPIGLVIGVSIALLFMHISIDLGSDANQQKIYLANDLALTVDTLHAIVGNIVYDYRENVRPYAFDISEGRVKVATPSSVPMWITGRYAEKESHPIGAHFETPPIISFSKAGSDIRISTERQAIGRTACPEANTGATLRELDIVIDPGQSSSDPGEQFVEYSEYRITLRIAQALQSICPNCRVLQQGTIDERIAAIGDADLVVSLHIGGHGNANGVLASHRIGDDASAKLGCLLANSMVRLEFLGQARTAPVDLSRLEESDARRVLSDTIPSAQFVIGNIAAPNPLANTEGIVRIATKIYEGLQEYTSGAPSALTEQNIFTIPTACENPRRGTTRGHEWEIISDTIRAAESVARDKGIPAAALLAISIHESGLNTVGTLGKPCPSENERGEFRPGDVVQRIFITGQPNSAPASCVQTRPDGDDRIVTQAEAQASGDSCEEHSCSFVAFPARLTCNNEQLRNLAAYQCVARYDSLRDAFVDWEEGLTRLAAQSSCAARPTTLNDFIDHVACVLYNNDDQWKQNINSIIEQNCFEVEQ